MFEYLKFVLGIRTANKYKNDILHMDLLGMLHYNNEFVMYFGQKNMFKIRKMDISLNVNI